MDFRPSQWLAYFISNLAAFFKAWLPAGKHYTWYGIHRILLIATVKYGIDTFWLSLRPRKLGVSFSRELSLVYWVPNHPHYEWNPVMRMFIRKCGYHYSQAGVGFGKRVEPWFYGETTDKTKAVLQRIEEKAVKRARLAKIIESVEMQAVSRVLKNFGEFSMDEVMIFFKLSELVDMDVGQVIFGPEDTEEFCYGVVSGEIHLLCEDFGNRGVELLKVAGPDDCIASLLAFIHFFVSQPQTFGELKLTATCGVKGQYYRVPMLEILKFLHADNKRMFDVFRTILRREYKFLVGLNDLTGILPRLHRQEYLDPSTADFDIPPGILPTNGIVAQEAFDGLASIMQVEETDRRLCWVGVLDSRTVLLRRYKSTKYAFYIHKGLVACTVSKLRRSFNAVQFYLSSGQIIGWREAISGAEMSVQYQVADGAKVLIIAIPDYLVSRFLLNHPNEAKNLIYKAVERCTLLARQIDYAVTFAHKRANEAVYCKSETNSEELDLNTYLCLSGRMRFSIDTDSKFQKPSNVARYGIHERGDWVGLVAMYTDKPHMHRNVICDRLSEYVIVPRLLICAITAAFREAAGYQCDYMAALFQRDHEQTFLDTDKMADTRYQVNSLGCHTWRTFRLICVYPAAEDLPAKIYCDELARHHTSSAGVVTRDDALTQMGLKGFSTETEYALSRWLVEQEEKFTVLFVVATNDVTDLWNEAAAKICDMIQVLVSYGIPHKPNDDEVHIIGMAAKARKELIFIHPVVRVTRPQVGPSKFPHLPQGSCLWLGVRPWIQRHHHVRMVDYALKYMKEKNPEDLAKYYKLTRDPDKWSDFGRVMRWISGQSVGIVLGGGGAKGAAHLGALRYLAELDVPVDYIGGVSMGSFLGALYAVYENIDTVEQRASELWGEFTLPTRYARDFPYHPFTAVFRGHSFSFLIYYFLGTIQIEDLYIPYFCVSSDLDDNCSRTHMSGDLWFFVRASMTLTMVFPPQINHFDYHLLMDGGYSDLVPAMAMRKLGIKYLVAVNIGDETLINTFNLGYHCSGLTAVVQNLMPHAISPVPNRFDFWDAMLYCSARNFIQILKAMDEYCIYIRPNINAYNALDFKYYQELKTLGYLSTKFKFGGLNLKNLPVHVIWYLLRFYTYPSVAMSQTQILQGFQEEDWKFAIELMSKTQMFSRAKTVFLMMNLTPYLTDIMEARSYLESIIKDDDVRNINLHVPVLENFSRDDERLDLVHALARMMEINYMEDFETIKERTEAGATDLRVKTALHVAASQTHDLMNLFGKAALTSGESKAEMPAIYSATEPGPDQPQKIRSIRDLFKADPTLFHGLASFHNLHAMNKKLKEPVRPPSEDVGESFGDTHRTHVRSKKHARSLPSLHSLFAKIGHTVKPVGESKPTQQGQRLVDFRKCLTKADRSKEQQLAEPKFTQIVTLKQLRQSFANKGMTQL